MANADDVLKELARIGALGTKAPTPSLPVEVSAPVQTQTSDDSVRFEVLKARAEGLLRTLDGLAQVVAEARKEVQLFLGDVSITDANETSGNDDEDEVDDGVQVQREAFKVRMERTRALVAQRKAQEAVREENSRDIAQPGAESETVMTGDFPAFDLSVLGSLDLTPSYPENIDAEVSEAP